MKLKQGMHPTKMLSVDTRRLEYYRELSRDLIRVDGKCSSEEDENDKVYYDMIEKNPEVQEKKKTRKSKAMSTMSNVRRKLSLTFARRNSGADTSIESLDSGRDFVDTPPSSPNIQRWQRRTRRGNIVQSISLNEMQSQYRESSQQAMRNYTVFILGGKSVGKTALAVRFLTGRYIHEYTSSQGKRILLFKILH